MSRSGSHTAAILLLKKDLPGYNMTSKSMHDNRKNCLKKFISLTHSLEAGDEIDWEHSMLR